MFRETVDELHREVEELKARNAQLLEVIGDIGWRLTWLERGARVPMSQADRVLAGEFHQRRRFRASLLLRS